MKRTQIEQLLPEVYQRAAASEPLLGVLLQLMEDLHARAEDRLDHLEEIFDPRRTDDRFVPYLASWLDLTHVFPSVVRSNGRRSSEVDSIPLPRLRELTAGFARLSRWRGSRRGLLQFLTLATGSTDFRIQENVTKAGHQRAFHFVVVAPDELRPQRELLEAIISAAKPAFATSELAFEPSTPRIPAA